VGRTPFVMARFNNFRKALLFFKKRPANPIPPLRDERRHSLVRLYSVDLYTLFDEQKKVNNYKIFYGDVNIT